MTSYMVGLFDGEGSLIIRFTREKRHGWDGYSISFRCEITNKNQEIIRKIKSFFGFGRIDIDKRSNAHIWRSDSLKGAKKMIAFFEQNPLIIKNKDFAIFKKAYEIYVNRPKRRVTQKLFQQIYEMRQPMNGGHKSIRKPLPT